MRVAPVGDTRRASLPASSGFCLPYFVPSREEPLALLTRVGELRSDPPPGWDTSVAVPTSMRCASVGLFLTMAASGFWVLHVFWLWSLVVRWILRGKSTICDDAELIVASRFAIVYSVVVLGLAVGVSYLLATSPGSLLRQLLLVFVHVQGMLYLVHLIVVLTFLTAWFTHWAPAMEARVLYANRVTPSATTAMAERMAGSDLGVRERQSMPPMIDVAVGRPVPAVVSGQAVRPVRAREELFDELRESVRTVSRLHEHLQSMAESSRRQGIEPDRSQFRGLAGDLGVAEANLARLQLEELEQERGFLREIFLEQMGRGAHFRVERGGSRYAL